VDGTGGGAVLVLIRVLVPVDLLEERRHRGLESRLATKHIGGTVVVVVVVVVVVGRAIALKATDASMDDTVDDTVDGIFDVGVLAVLVLVVPLVVEERRHRGLDWRLTTKHFGGTVVVVVVGRAIALEATDVSMDTGNDTVDDTVDGIFDVVLAVLGVLVVEERRQLGLDWRLTTKHGEGAVVVAVFVVGGVGRAIALKATDLSVDDTGDDTVDGIFDCRGMF